MATASMHRLLSEAKHDEATHDHPYKKVLLLLDSLHAKALSHKQEAIVVLVKKYQTKMKDEMEDADLPGTAELHEYIKGLNYDLSATRALVNELIQTLGIHAAKFYHLPQLEAVVDAIKKELYQAKALCVAGPKSEDEYLDDMSQKVECELKQSTLKSRAEIIAYYDLLSERAKLLMDIRKNYKRRLASRFGIKFGFVAPVKGSIEDILDRISKVGEKISAAYSKLEGDYRAGCEAILRDSKSDLEALNQLKLDQQKDGKATNKKTDFDWKKFDDLSSKLSASTDKFYLHLQTHDNLESKASADDADLSHHPLLSEMRSEAVPEAKKIKKSTSMQNLNRGIFSILEGSRSNRAVSLSTTSTEDGAMRARLGRKNSR